MTHKAEQSSSQRHDESQEKALRTLRRAEEQTRQAAKKNKNETLERLKRYVSSSP